MAVSYEQLRSVILFEGRPYYSWPVDPSVLRFEEWGEPEATDRLVAAGLIKRFKEGRLLTELGRAVYQELSIGKDSSILRNALS
jgi:hypothetical protein